jgi:PGF-CTERM protein
MTGGYGKTMGCRKSRVLGRQGVIVGIILLLFVGWAVGTVAAQDTGDESDGEGDVIFEEEFDYPSVESSPWKCYNRPYNYRNVEYDRTSTKGFCNIGEGSAKVQEESARMRYLGRTLTLPETDDTLTLEARVRGRISDQWSHSIIGVIGDSSTMYPEASDETNIKKVEIISSSDDYPGITVTDWETVEINVTEYAGEEIRLAMYANGRWVFENQETTSWVEADYINIREEEAQPKPEIANGGEGDIIFEEEFDYSSVESSPWECYNRPYGFVGGADRTSTRGFCTVDDGGTKVQEESNRRRYLSRTLSIPETDGNLTVEARARGRVSDKWSTSGIIIAADPGVRYPPRTNDGSDFVPGSLTTSMNVLDSRYDDPGVTVTEWKTVKADITEHAGEEARLAVYANGRGSFESQETTAWVEVDYIRIKEASEGEQEPSVVEEGAGDGDKEIVISRISDGELYQTGKLTEVAGTVEAGGNISVTAEIQAEAPEASDDIVYGSVGLSDGTVLDVEQMDGLGGGTVTHSLNIPESPHEDVVWSFHSAVTEEDAIERFESDAQDGFVDDQGRNLDIVILEESVSRISDGEPYQTGKVTEVVGTVEAGSNISVTAEIKGKAAEASDDTVYGSIGLSDGTVLDVERMEGSGNGTITHTLRIPETAQGDVVWSFHSTTTEKEATERFESDAQDGFVDDQGRNRGIVIDTVNVTSSEGEEGLPGFTVVAALIALITVAFVLRSRG